jgi:MurE/MurF fusion protein
MLLSNLVTSERKIYKKIPVKGISFDSKRVKKNYIFFAIKGSATSGYKYINDAILNGASAIICDSRVKLKNYKIPVLIVDDVRKALSEACSKFYKKKPKHITAVTGTNGKSSVANFFYQILSLSSIRAASIGTLGIQSQKYHKKTNLTSMNPLSLHSNLQKLKEEKINHVVLEASSHGLKQKRLDYLNINTGIFTNLSHDHLDYHKDMTSYLNAKMYLFKKLLKKNSKIITDEENKEFKDITKISKERKIKCITIGTSSGNIRVLQNSYKGKKQIVKVLINSKVFEVKTSLIGYFQIKNLLMAILAASECGLKLKTIFNKINNIKPVPGRLECVASLKNNSEIIIDFAHTPDALKQSLIALKKQFKKEIIIVFGCGGERDKKKRYTMGEISKTYCRKIFVTDDNPRTENAKKIRNEIIKGCGGKAINIGNRKKAIQVALNNLDSNEILLIAGKGHETSQDYGKKVLKISDKEIIKELVKNKKFSYKKEIWSESIAKKVFNKPDLKNINYNGVSINSNNIKKNNLFFAIKGKNKDGHKFAREAIRKGAIKSVVSKKINHLSAKKVIKVKDTFQSLNNLARFTRYNSYAKIIGITGSVGKTTLKYLISFSLSNYGKVYYSPHSYNNKYGVPLSISNLKKNTKYGVFEIGMDKKGEIDNLSKIVKPEIGIITNVSEAHLKNFKSIKDIAKAKSEIIKNITKGGTVILNKDGNFFNFLSKIAKKNSINVISFGIKNKSDILLLNIRKFKTYFRLSVSVNNKIFYFFTKYSTDSFLYNILACISAMYILNLNLYKMKKKFINFKIPDGRGDISKIKRFNKNFKFIDESYNASPLSMSLAIKNMHIFKGKKINRKMVFLSDMLELGGKSKKLHRELSLKINKTDIDKVFVFGKHIKETYNYLSKNKKGKIFKNLSEAYTHIGKILHNNDLLMVKGSNATGLNKFSKNIKKGQISVI